VTGTSSWRSRIRSPRTALIAAGVVTVAVVLIVVGATVGAGAPAPHSLGKAKNFTLSVLGHPGQHLSLQSLDGTPVIVNFFASWCEPCQQETPLLARFYRGEHGQVALVGLDENDILSHALSFTGAKGVTYPVGWDPENTAASAYGVGGLPQTFFLDARHRIVDRVFGAVTLAELDKGIALATGQAAS
jgi:cytochrome c biogenesis protein CcmG, thiol:disulfide interchange protein DsbE